MEWSPIQTCEQQHSSGHDKATCHHCVLIAIRSAFNEHSARAASRKQGWITSAVARLKRRSRKRGTTATTTIPQQPHTKQAQHTQHEGAASGACNPGTRASSATTTTPHATKTHATKTHASTSTSTRTATSDTRTNDHDDEGYMAEDAAFCDSRWQWASTRPTLLGLAQHGAQPHTSALFNLQATIHVM